MYKFKTQFGFSVVEVLLALAIIVLVAVSAWMAYRIHLKTTPTASVSGSATQSATQRPLKYFTISEWKVRAPYSGKLRLEYTINTTSLPAYVNLSSKELDNSAVTCKPDANGYGYGGTIQRYASSETVRQGDGNIDTGLTPANFFAQSSNSKRVFKKIGNYYYLYAPPQGVCSASRDSQNLETQTDNATIGIVKNLQAAPN